MLNYQRAILRLMFAIPNTIGTYEPVLLRGSASRAFLSTPAALHVQGLHVEGRKPYAIRIIRQNLFSFFTQMVRVDERPS